MPPDQWVLRLRRRRNRRRGHRTVGAPPLVAAFFVPLLCAVWLGSCAAVVSLRYVAEVNSEYGSVEDALAARGGGARIYDRNGTLLYEFLDEGYGQHRPVKLDQISPWLQSATIAVEDDSFYSNPGVNIRGTFRAVTENLTPGRFLTGTGGSSITQQLVKQIYFSQDERERRSIDRKVKEALLALRITREYEKDQILEWYLNEIPYGNLAIGAEAASLSYFGISAKDLTLAQAAFLAGLPQSPTEFDPFINFDGAKKRQAEVLLLMERHGVIDSQTRAWAMLEDIKLNPAPQPFLAPHFVLYVGDYLRATLGDEALYHGGLSVLTTLDLGLQEDANAILEQNLEKYENSSQGHNGSVVIIQPSTGRILAMVGSRDYFRADVNGEVNNAIAMNSPGSTLKPFTYATAFMMGWGPDWPILDTPITYKQPDGKEFSPRNPDGRTRGPITAREALGNSFNIPAFKTILWTGVDGVRDTAKRMGITTLDRDLGPAMTLGGVDVKLLDLTYAYSVFANNGIMAGVPASHGLGQGNRTLDPNPVLLVTSRSGDVLMDNSVPDSTAAMEPQYTYLITEILSDDSARSITYGRGSTLNIPGRRVAVKTGTSEPYEDSRKLIGDTWTVGYSPDIAVGVWVGNSDNSPMVNISSTTIAGSTWHDVMLRAHEGLPPHDWIEPPGIVEATVCVPSGVVAESDSRCRKVKGRFVLEALARQTDNWWGGEMLSSPRTEQSLSKVPAELDEWKRYLADEYLHRYGGGSPRKEESTPAPPPPLAAQPTVAPLQPAPPTPEPTQAPVLTATPVTAVPSPPPPEPTKDGGPGRR
ncbi:MAG: transglycosylase domain-containing protein [Chloroflexi bacterium]|nr:transglycosylase domain-containing protein [Chloroflexota bacterium]